jgi:septal ring factor EnvC (AmiA/AmiB activator)
MHYLAQDDGRRLEAYGETARALVETGGHVASRRDEARALQGEARARRVAATAAYARKQELLGSLQQEAGQRERWLAELVAARGTLEASMANRPPGPAPPRGLGAPFTSRRRQLPWPVAGAVTGRFGRQRDPQFGTSTVSNGITIATPLGTPVHAVHAGTVAFAGAFAGFGQLVILDHGAQTYSLYGYLSTVRVQPGMTVEAGAPVGDVGDSPTGDAALYLEVRVDGRPVDPLQWLKRAR